MPPPSFAHRIQWCWASAPLAAGRCAAAKPQHLLCCLCVPAYVLVLVRAYTRSHSEVLRAANVESLSHNCVTKAWIVRPSAGVRVRLLARRRRRLLCALLDRFVLRAPRVYRRPARRPAARGAAAALKLSGILTLRRCQGLVPVCNCAFTGAI